MCLDFKVEDDHKNVIIPTDINNSNRSSISKIDERP